MRLLTTLIAFMAAGVAFGVYDSAYMAADTSEVYGETIAKIIAWVVGAHFMLYGVAEGLTRIAVKTDAKWDNKLASVLSQIAWILGSFLGKFGYSVPKEVLKAKVEKLKAKPDSNPPS